MSTNMFVYLFRSSQESSHLLLSSQVCLHPDQPWMKLNYYMWVSKSQKKIFPRFTRPQSFRSKTCVITFHMFETHGLLSTVFTLAPFGTSRKELKMSEFSETSEGFCNFKLGLLLVKLMSTATLLDGHSGHSPLVLFGLKLRKLMAGMFYQRPLKQYVCM